jgi:hypothetical protein
MWRIGEADPLLLQLGSISLKLAFHIICIGNFKQKLLNLGEFAISLFSFPAFYLHPILFLKLEVTGEVIQYNHLRQISPQAT